VATNSAAQVSTIFEVAVMPARRRAARTSASVFRRARRSAVRKTHLLGLPKHVGVAGAARRSRARRGRISRMFSRNHGSIDEEREAPGWTLPRRYPPPPRSSARRLGTRIFWRRPSSSAGGPSSRAPSGPARASDGLLERLLEGADDGHGLAHRLHLRGQRLVRLGEFSKASAGT